MGYREIIEEDYLDSIIEKNVSYLDEITKKMKLGDVSVFAGGGIVCCIRICGLEEIIRAN